MRLVPRKLEMFWASWARSREMTSGKADNFGKGNTQQDSAWQAVDEIIDGRNYWCGLCMQCQLHVVFWANGWTNHTLTQWLHTYFIFDHNHIASRTQDFGPTLGLTVKMVRKRNLVLAEDCAGLGPLHESCKLLDSFSFGDNEIAAC